MTPHSVTDHACIRFFERVHHVDFAALFPTAAHDGERLAAICRYMDISHSDARDLVCPPRLHIGVALGASAIIAGGHRMVCAGGRVVTVLTPEPRLKRRRIVEMEIAA